MKSAVVVFPGSNCDRDLAVALSLVSSKRPVMLWHDDTHLPQDLDLIAIPGGFSHGDYLRSGAIAARAPIMREVRKAADRGTPVLGICNGFQILTEAGILPGALVRNAGIDFVCRDVDLEVVTTDNIFTSAFQPGETIRIPIAHQEGNYQADAETLDRLEQQGRIAFRYREAANGSARGIAGILNARGNVLGLMPHPERAVEPAHGSTDGARLFQGIMGALV